MKRIHKDKVPKRVLKLFSTNEKPKWLVNDNFEFDSVFYLICFAYMTYSLVLPFLYYDYQVLFYGLSLDKSIFEFLFQNILAFLALSLLYIYVEYCFFTKIILSNKKLYISKLFKVVSIEKNNLDRNNLFKANIFMFFMSILQTIDGKQYLFPSTSICEKIYLVLGRNNSKKKLELVDDETKKQKTQKINPIKKIIYNPLVAVLIVCSIPLILSFPLNLFLYDFTDILLPAKEFKHNALYRSLKVLDALNFQDSKVAIFLRNELFEHYYIMYRSFDDKKYNAIAPIYQVVDEFKYYDKKQQENYKKLKNEDKALEYYTKHRERIVDEISNIFVEYENRDEYYLAGINLNSTGKKLSLPVVGYSVPDRLTLYPYFATFYFEYTQEFNNIEEQRNILSSYDRIYEHEKSNNSPMFRIANKKQKQYFEAVGKFWGLYSYGILNSELNNNYSNFCSNTEIFDKFSQVYKTSDKYIEMMNTIVKTCDYQIN